MFVHGGSCHRTYALIKCFVQVDDQMLNRISFAAALLVSAALATSPALAASGPVGVWKLDEGSGTRVADGSGNGNNGVLSGGVSWVPGTSGSALSFDGVSGELKIADNDALEPASTLTVSAWIKNAGSPGKFSYVVAKGATSCIAASYGLYSGPDGGLDFYVSHGHGSVYARSPDAGQGVWDGNWHLAVGTYDGHTIRLYVDGVEVGTGTPWTGALEYVLPNSNDFYIGNYPGCADHAFQGAIDDVMVWDRTLDATDVAGLLPPASIPPSQPAPPSGAGGAQGGGGTHTTGGGNGGNGGTGTPAKTKDPLPSISGVKLSNQIVTVDMHGNLISKGLSGPSLTYTESEAAKLTVTLLRSENGVRRGKRCVAPAGHRRARGCTHFVVISSVNHTDQAGSLTLRLNQLLKRHLSPGTYRLDVTPRAQGKVGKTVSVHFVVRQSHRRG
jgi:hypothetical protein